MSRNFELLQRLERERQSPSTGMFTAESDEHRALRPMALGPVHPEFHRFVRRTFLSGGGEPRRLIAFTGAEAGAGCSWVAARAAETLALQTSSSVCLVDAGFGSPHEQHDHLDDDRHGLSDALIGDGPLESFLHSNPGGVTLMTRGSLALDADSAFVAEKICSRMLELRSAFEFILIDAPLVRHPITVALAKPCDGSILVLKAHHTTRETARKCLQELAAANVNVVGTVLNQREYPIPESIYKRL